MWQRLTGVTSPRGERKLPNERVHFDDPQAVDALALALDRHMEAVDNFPGPVRLVCIGTDRSTGDALGPIVGSQIERWGDPNLRVYGTLDQPVHAANLAETIARLDTEEPQAVTIAIDACLGKSEHIGQLKVKQGPLLPGQGVNKRLPPVGDFHMIGIVNVGGFMEYFVLQNTRLNLVMRMADTMVRAIELWHTRRCALLRTSN